MYQKSNTRSNFGTKTLVAVGILGGLASSPVVAQGSMALEEIVVTARKRAETLQEVPVTVTAFTAATIQKSGLTDITSLAMMTPNLSYQSSFGRHFDRPTIRGMSNILGEANAGNFIDGIFVSGSVMTQELTNLERVEVIKGPQAALYGRATFAGAINFITKSPTETPEGMVTGTVATRDHYEIAASHSGPLINDKLGYFISGRYYERGNQYENRGTGGPKTGAGAQRSYGVTAKLKADPSDAFSASLRLSFADDRDAETGSFLTQTADNNCFLNRGGYICGQFPIVEFVSLSFADFPNEFIGIDRQTYRTHLTMEYDFGGVTLTSNSSYNYEDFYRQSDQDYIRQTTSAGAVNQRVNIDNEDYSQELRLSSDPSQQLRWLAGAYYYHLDRTESRITYLTSGARPFETRPPQEVDNYAVFGSLEFDFNDQLTGTAEIRRSWDKLATTGRTVSGAFVNNFDLKDTFSSWSPRFIMKYKATPDSMIYASVAKGNKPGGFNTSLQRADAVPSERTRLAQFIAFDEESSWNYEIGSKNTLLDGLMNFNAAAFYIDWSKQQLTFTEQVQVFNVGGLTTRPVGISIIQNAGVTEIYGIELESNWQVTDIFSLNAAYGYSHAEFKKFDDPTQLALTGSASVAGNAPPRAPRHKVAFGAAVEVPIRDELNWFARTEYSYESSRFDQVQNLLTTGPTTRLSARVGIRNDVWEVAAWGKNLTTDKSVVDITRLFDPLMTANRGFLGILPDKRQFGLTGTYRF